MSENYLHGYHREERDRLARQARFLEEKIYSGLDLSQVTKLLEVGSGNGAQSEIILERWRSLRLTGVDVSGEQVSQAQARLRARSALDGRWEFRQTDASHLPFGEKTFDGAFFCWVLEHVANPKHILRETKRVLAPGGKVFLTEVFNHSFYAEPPMPALAAYWQKYNTLQTRFDGDPQVGAKLGQYLDEVGFVEVKATPRTFFFDRWSTTIIRGHRRQLKVTGGLGWFLYWFMVSATLRALEPSPSVERSLWRRQAPQTEWNRGGWLARPMGPPGALVFWERARSRW